MTRRRPRTRSSLVLLALGLSAVPVAVGGGTGPAGAAGTFLDPLPGTLATPTALTVDPSNVDTAVLTITNPSGGEFAGVDLPPLNDFQWASVSGSCSSTTPLPSADFASISIDPGRTCTVWARLASPPAAPGSSIEETIYVLAYEVDFGNLDGYYTLRATTPIPPPAVNDDITQATDISNITIPPYAGGASGPLTVASVTGTTLGSTLDAAEIAAGFAPDTSGSVWFRYTATAASEGRLGYRPAPGVLVNPWIAAPNVTAPASYADVVMPSQNTTSPWSRQFVRVEAGQTIWFQAVQLSSSTPGEFTLDLFQAPDPTEDIALAYNGTGDSDAPMFVPPDGSETGIFGDGDTFHTVGDDLGDGSAVTWWTLRFDEPVAFNAQVASIDAALNGSLRPLRLRVFRAPTTAFVALPSALGAPIATVDSAVGGPTPFVSGSSHQATLATITLTPGRYYLAVSTAASQPTIFYQSYRWSAAGPGDTTPPTVRILEPFDGWTYEAADVPATVWFEATDDSGVSPTCTTTPATPPATPGQHTIRVECTDAAGNVGSAQSTYTVRAPLADLSVTGRVQLAAAVVPAPVGSDITGTVGIANDGPQGTTAQVRVTLDGLALRPGAPLPAGYSAATGVWTVTVPAGTSTSVQLPLVATRAGTTTLTAEVIASSIGDPDSTPGNGTGNTEDDHGSATIEAVAPVSQFVVQYSSSNTRSPASAIDGATVSGAIAIFVPATPDIARVEFFLDNPTMTGTPRRVDRFAPYDFVGRTGSRARLFSTRTLADGVHTITARVVLRNGTTEIVTSTFTVSNPRPATRQLLVSTQGNRAGAMPLDGATITGPVAVYVPNEPAIGRIEFRIDGRWVRAERLAPYDFGGTRGNGQASLVRFNAGIRTVTARIVFTDGSVDTIQARFTAS